MEQIRPGESINLPETLGITGEIRGRTFHLPKVQQVVRGEDGSYLEFREEDRLGEVLKMRLGLDDEEGVWYMALRGGPSTEEGIWGLLLYIGKEAPGWKTS